jgi:hypothetical protein
VIGRRIAILLLALLGVVAAVAVAAVQAGDRRTIGRGQIRFDGLGPERWAARFRHAHRQILTLRHEVRRLHRILIADPKVVEAINLACATYGNCSTLWRKAECETGGTLSPRSLNSSSGAAGLYQFLPSTWASTPYGRFSVWSPYANALAAGWMHTHGRGSEWSCR